MRKFIWILLALSISWGLIWYVCINRKKVLPLIQSSEPEVEVTKIQPQDVTLTHEYIGHVEAIHSVSVYPYISGFIEQVLVEGGAEVSAGQSLFILRQDQYLAEVESAEAKVVGATADLEKARLYLERINNTASEAISKTERDDAQTAFLTAEANLSAAKAALKSAQINYNYTIIAATINGVVGNISATKGEYVSPDGHPLAYVLQYNPIRIRFSMPEKDFLNLGADVSFFKTGQLKLKLSNGEIITAAGSVRFADNQIQSGTSSIDLFADFENKQHLLLPGAYVTVLYDEQISDAILIERHIITMQSDGNYIYILTDGIIRKLPIKISGFIGTKALIKAELNPQDLLITTPISQNEIGKEAKIKMDSSNDIF